MQSSNQRQPRRVALVVLAASSPATHRRRHNLQRPRRWCLSWRWRWTCHDDALRRPPRPTLPPSTTLSRTTTATTTASPTWTTSSTRRAARPGANRGVGLGRPLTPMALGLPPPRPRLARAPPPGRIPRPPFSDLRRNRVSRWPHSGVEVVYERGTGCSRASARSWPGISPRENTQVGQGLVAETHEQSFLEFRRALDHPDKGGNRQGLPGHLE